MSSEGDALGASYSRGERDYAGDATTLADPHVPAGRTGRPGISFLVVSAWATALVALWVYRRALVRALASAAPADVRTAQDGGGEQRGQHCQLDELAARPRLARTGEASTTARRAVGFADAPP